MALNTKIGESADLGIYRTRYLLLNMEKKSRFRSVIRRHVIHFVGSQQRNNRWAAPKFFIVLKGLFNKNRVWRNNL